MEREWGAGVWDWGCWGGRRLGGEGGGCFFEKMCGGGWWEGQGGGLNRVFER